VRDVDDPPLRPPLRVLLDGRGRVPAAGPLFDVSLAPTLVVTTSAAPLGVVDAWTSAGAKVEVIAPAADGSGVGIDLDAVFGLLGAEGVLQVLVEGGPTLLASVLEGGHAQHLVAYVAPIVLGTEGRAAFGVAGPPTLTAGARFVPTGVRALGPDVRLDYEVRA
jgi:diaminohydroxyphosphoribosylaminopyrimidine deaminase/5-amino-6-(5-phosphoribosylamino)uracil reductase